MRCYSRFLVGDHYEMAVNNHHERDKLDEDAIRVKAFRWIKDSVGGVWAKITVDEMVIEPVRQV